MKEGITEIMAPNSANFRTSLTFDLTLLRRTSFTSCLAPPSFRLILLHHTRSILPLHTVQTESFGRCKRLIAIFKYISGLQSCSFRSPAFSSSVTASSSRSLALIDLHFTLLCARCRLERCLAETSRLQLTTSGIPDFPRRCHFLAFLHDCSQLLRTTIARCSRWFTISHNLTTRLHVHLFPTTATTLQRLGQEHGRCATNRGLPPSEG